MQVELKQEWDDVNKRVLFTNDGYNLKFIRNFGRVFDNKDFLDVEIKRYLKTDSFALKIIFKTEERFQFRISLQINNVVLFDGPILQSGENNVFETVINSDSLGKIGNNKLVFSGVNHIVVSVHKINEKQLTLRQAVQILFKKNKIKRDYYLDASNELIFKTKRIISGKEISYNHILLRGVPWLIGENNTKVFDIFVWNDAGDSVDFDLDVKTGDIFGLPLKGGDSLETNFVINKDYRPELAKEIPYGSIQILNNTFFNHQLQSTFKGNEAGAKQGYIIPLNFSGKLYPTLKLRLNSSFPDVEVTRQIHLKKSMFGDVNSIFSLEVINSDETYDDLIAWERIPDDIFPGNNAIKDKQGGGSYGS